MVPKNVFRLHANVSNGFREWVQAKMFSVIFRGEEEAKMFYMEEKTSLATSYFRGEE
jgi:hypothetical protein